MARSHVVAGLLALLLVVPGGAEAATGKRQRELVGAVNLNTATIEQLCLLPGVGPRTAERIVELRRKRPFRQSSEVLRVKGIGPKFFRTHKARLKVEGPSDLGWVEVERPRT